MVARIEQETAYRRAYCPSPTVSANSPTCGCRGRAARPATPDEVGLVGLSDWLSSQIRRTTQSDREPTSELTRRLESTPMPFRC